MIVVMMGTLGAAAALSLIALGLVAPAAGGASSHPVVAPYLDMGADHPANLYAAIKRDHLRSFSAGFVIGHGCTPTWDDSVPVAKDASVNHVVTEAKHLGATPIISFGGEAQPELARSCTSKAHLFSAYQSVIKRFHATNIDFDIEGDAITEPSSIKRRFQVIHSLERHDGALNVSLTVPVTPQGLDSDGTSLMQAAHKYGAVVDLVNIMAMDYDTASAPEMGTTAIAAAKHTRSQLAKIYGHYSYANLGITPMIGLNDPAAGEPDEMFTTADAKSVASWAKSHHVGRLAFWALGRDGQCSSALPPDPSSAPDSCSGTTQKPLQFSKIFVG